MVTHTCTNDYKKLFGAFEYTCILVVHNHTCIYLISRSWVQYIIFIITAWKKMHSKCGLLNVHQIQVHSTNHDRDNNDLFTHI